MLDVVKSNAAAKKIKQYAKNVKAVEAYRNAKEAGDRIFATKETDSEKWNVAGRVIMRVRTFQKK